MIPSFIRLECRWPRICLVGMCCPGMPVLDKAGVWVMNLIWAWMFSTMEAGDEECGIDRRCSSEVIC